MAAVSGKWHRDVKETDEFSEFEYEKQKRQRRLRNKRKDKRKIEPLFDDRFNDEVDTDYQEDDEG